MERIKQAILASLEYASGESSIDSIMEKVEDGKYQTWEIDNLVILTSVVQYEQTKRLRICYCHGSMDEDTVIKALAIMEQFAESVDCDGVELMGRQGWIKHLKKYGYAIQYTSLLKRLP